MTRRAAARPNPTERGPLARPRFLFAVLGAPVLWALHLPVCYFLLTLDCISGWGGAGWSLVLVTAVFAGGTVAAGWTAYRMRESLTKAGGKADAAPDAEPDAGPDAEAGAEAEASHGFLLLLGIGGSALFTAAVVAEGVAPFFVRFCP